MTTPGTEHRICLITGGTSGIGRATARTLAEHGLTVIIAGRSPDRCIRAVHTLRQRTGSPHIDYVSGDMADYEQVRAMAASVMARYERLDVLINNAGAMFTSRRQTVDGHEMTLAVNYLGHYLLTNLLLDTLGVSGSARILNIASQMHTHAHLDLDDLHLSRGYSGWTAYSNAKLAQILFTAALAQRLAGTGITANALHPGSIQTDFLQHTGCRSLDCLSPAENAQLSVYLATSPEVAHINGHYFTGPAAHTAAADAADPTTIARLWEVSGQLTGLNEKTLP